MDRGTDDGSRQPADARSPPGTARNSDGSPKRCDYCRLPIPGEPTRHRHEGDTYEFCSASCRDALAEGESTFTEYHGFRRTETGLAGLDAALPRGILRNSFVLVSDLAGTRSEAIQAELVWRALRREEPVVFVSFLEPPVSIVQLFVSLEWNVLPYLERGQLRILDCFTYRVDDRSRMYERMNPWNAHIWSIAEDATTTVRDPSDMAQLQSRLDGALEDGEMQDRGLVVIDSLTELGSHVQPVQAYNFVKDVRADVCKGRFVPVFAGASVVGEPNDFPHDLEYMVDGIVELRLDEELVDDGLVKQLRVRKMSGVPTVQRWESFEYEAGTGIVSVDPAPEQGNGGGQSRTGGGQSRTGGDQLAGNPTTRDRGRGPGTDDAPVDGSRGGQGRQPTDGAGTHQAGDGRSDGEEPD